jgi:hypothetical protein
MFSWEIALGFVLPSQIVAGTLEPRWLRARYMLRPSPRVDDCVKFWTKKAMRKEYTSPYTVLFLGKFDMGKRQNKIVIRSLRHASRK